MADALTIGVDIGGSRTKYGLVNIVTGTVVHSIVKPTEKKDPDLFLQQIEFAVSAFKDVAAHNGHCITSIGFGVPGFVNDAGIIETTYGFLEFMENYPLKEIVENQYSFDCFLDNDARTVCLGEAIYGKGKNFNRVLTLTLGTGVGFGFVVNRSFTDAIPLAHMGVHIKITDEGEV